MGPTLVPVISHYRKLFVTRPLELLELTSSYALSNSDENRSMAASSSGVRVYKGSARSKIASKTFLSSSLIFIASKTAS